MSLLNSSDVENVEGQEKKVHPGSGKIEVSKLLGWCKSNCDFYHYFQYYDQPYAHSFSFLTFIYFETGSHYVAQAGLNLLGSVILPA